LGLFSFSASEKSMFLLISITGNKNRIIFRMNNSRQIRFMNP
jgi:hypothetical protein